MTQAEYDREVAFADWYHKNGKGTPTYSDAIKESVRKQADKIIEKVEFCSKDYKVNCKITTINNKSDTVYFLTKKK